VLREPAVTSPADAFSAAGVIRRREEIQAGQTQQRPDTLGGGRLFWRRRSVVDSL